MNTPPIRVPIGVRLNPDQHVKVEALARAETDGNLSLMVRKLISEALALREKAAQ